MLTHHAIENAGRRRTISRPGRLLHKGRVASGWAEAPKARAERRGGPERFARCSKGGCRTGADPDDLQGEHSGEASRMGLYVLGSKSVSMQALVAGDQAVIEAQTKRLRAAVALMEKQSMCARRCGQEPSRANRESRCRRVPA